MRKNRPFGRDIPEEETMKKSVPCLSLLLFFLVIFLMASCGPSKGTEENAQAPAIEKSLEEKDLVVYKASIEGGKERTALSLDFSTIKRPASLDEFSKSFHTPPIQQFRTDACWCFATTSLFESERHRLGKPEVKLSEMHTVYWEFVEKARHFVRDKGTSDLRRGPFKGYFFYRDDYVRLKTLMFMVHKDAVPDLFQKFSVR
jgi:bleomycin hydrolase